MFKHKNFRLTNWANCWFSPCDNYYKQLWIHHCGGEIPSEWFQPIWLENTLKNALLRQWWSAVISSLEHSVKSKLSETQWYDAQIYISFSRSPNKNLMLTAIPNPSAVKKAHNCCCWHLAFLTLNMYYADWSSM